MMIDRIWTSRISYFTYDTLQREALANHRANELSRLLFMLQLRNGLGSSDGDHLYLVTSQGVFKDSSVTCRKT